MWHKTTHNLTKASKTLTPYKCAQLFWWLVLQASQSASSALFPTRPSGAFRHPKHSCRLPSRQSAPYSEMVLSSGRHWSVHVSSHGGMPCHTYLGHLEQIGYSEMLISPLARKQMESLPILHCPVLLFFCGSTGFLFFSTVLTAAAMCTLLVAAVCQTLYICSLIWPVVTRTQLCSTQDIASKFGGGAHSINYSTFRL